MQSDVEQQPELNEQIKLASIVGRGTKGLVAKHITDAIEHVNKRILEGAKQDEIVSETGGLVHRGLHGGPVAIVPHGDVRVPKQTKPLTKPTRLGDLYIAPKLEDEIPSVMNTLVYPNAKIKTREGWAWPNRIEINPFAVKYPDILKRILSHEGAHVSSYLGRELGDALIGSSPETYTRLGGMPLLEQFDLAANIRSGRNLPPGTGKGWERVMNLSPEDFQKNYNAARIIRSFAGRGKGFNPYWNTYGEQLARFMEHEAGRSGTFKVPHTSPIWTGPQGFAKSPTSRITSQVDEKHSSLLSGDASSLINYFLEK